MGRDWSTPCSVGSESRLRTTAVDMDRNLKPSLMWLLMLVLATTLDAAFENTVVEDIPSHGTSLRMFPRQPEKFLEFADVNHLMSRSTEFFDQFFYESSRLFVGSRAVVYDIDLNTLQLSQRIDWPSTISDIDTCRLRQMSEDDCDNYIKVITRHDANEYFICGTNAYNPKCRVYRYNRLNRQYTTATEVNGMGRCPFSRTHNSTTHVIDGRFYHATASDWAARHSIIYSVPIRTELNSLWLNDAQFVSSFHHAENVYFFFRETANEYINCGKAVFSRVARLCKKDAGGARVLKDVWTSFFKARLNCSIPGSFPFYFDEIQSTTELGNGNVFAAVHRNNREPMVYAVMSTPRNGIRGSAVCGFKMSDIERSFEGPFKEQATPHSNWLPVSDNDVPEPHPATFCANDSKSTSDHTLNFVKSHPLMDHSVSAAGNQPILIQSGFLSGFTVIAADWAVRAANGAFYDVLFIGTENGRVLKVINRAKQGQPMKPSIVCVWELFAEPIIHIRIVHTSTRVPDPGEKTPVRKLVVATRHNIVTLPVHQCRPSMSCSECVALKDPYCSWSPEYGCSHYSKGFQELDTGQHPNCRLYPSNTTAQDNTVSRDHSHQSERSLAVLNIDCTPQKSRGIQPHETNVSSQISGPCYTESWKGAMGTLYSAETIAMASTICILVSFTAGCTLGFGVATYRRSAVRDLMQGERRNDWAETATVPVPVANGAAASMSIARLHTVLNRYGVAVTGSQKLPAVTDKACQTGGGGSICRSSLMYRRINISPTTIVTNYAAGSKS